MTTHNPPTFARCLAVALLTCITPALACATDDTELAFDDGTETGDTGEPVEDDDLRSYRLVVPPPAPIPVGAQWGPCDLTGVNDPDWWGCDGEPGFGLACARPVSNGLNLNMCVPQTWDPAVPDNCVGLTAPFGKGVRLQGSAYCVVDCSVDSDCAGGMACSPASHMCAYKG